MTDLAIEIEGVAKAYRFFALKDVNLTLPCGQIMGLVGPNGAGKSTLIRILMSLIQQDHGQVRVLGHSMPEKQVAAKWQVGYVSEDMRLYGYGTVGWHMRFVASIYPSWDAPYAQTLLKRFNLRTEQQIRSLSHGERAKATLLLMLARRPRLLLLDEPTTGLDPVARHEMLVELMDVLRDERRAILFSSHNTQDVEQISDQITFIDRGKIIDSDDKEIFLDRWRRLRLVLPQDAAIPRLPGVIDVGGSSRLPVLTTNHYEPAMVSICQELGATVQAVDNMTLEEIFVANVQRRREAV